MKKRVVILEFRIPIGGKSKTRAKQSIYQLLENYKDILGYEDENVVLKTLTMPVKDDMDERFLGPFLTVVFDSNKDYKSEPVDEILSRVNTFNKNFLNEMDELLKEQDEEYKKLYEKLLEENRQEVKPQKKRFRLFKNRK